MTLGTFGDPSGTFGESCGLLGTFGEPTGNRRGPSGNLLGFSLNPAAPDIGSNNRITTPTPRRKLSFGAFHIVQSDSANGMCLAPRLKARDPNSHSNEAPMGISVFFLRTCSNKKNVLSTPTPLTTKAAMALCQANHLESLCVCKDGTKCH